MKLQELMAQPADIEQQIATEKATQLAACLERAVGVFTEVGMTEAEAADALIARFNKGLRKAKRAPRSVAPAMWARVSEPGT